MVFTLQQNFIFLLSTVKEISPLMSITTTFFRVLVNVVKYKLDHMRRRIETDERDSTNRASFRCPCCFSTFTDLEANQLFNPMTGKDLKMISVGGFDAVLMQSNDRSSVVQLSEM